MPTGGEKERRASIFEIVGAWLHVWVPPRDVEIPPVPWRKLAIGAAAGVIVLGVALAVMIPRIDAGKDRRAALDRARHERGIQANRVRVNRLQRPRHGSDPELRAPAGASAAEREAARNRLLNKIELKILADARARAAAGEMPSVTGPTICKTMQGTAPGRALGAFDCFVVGHRIAATKHSLPGATGYPFRAVVDFRHFSYAFCKVEQIPGEKLIPTEEKVTPLPHDCQSPPGI